MQAGLVAVALVGGLIATFGPFFSLGLGYILLSAAGAAAILSWRWAGRVLRSAEVRARARRDAQIGRLLASTAILAVLYYSGLWILLAVLWPLVLFLGLLAWSAHRSRVLGDSSPEARA